MADDKKFLPENAVNVNTGTFVGSVYSQIVGISVTDNDLTLEFVFLNPNNNKEGQKEGQVVSRVTLPINAGLVLASVIQKTYSEHIKKRKGTQ